MIAVLSIIAGIIVIAIAVLLIRREITRAVQSTRLLHQTRRPESLDWWERLQRLEAVQEETNASFYELVAALEERMSVVEGTLSDLETPPPPQAEPIEQAERPVARDPELEEKLRKISQLEDQGLSEQQIAKHLGMGLGELKLLKHRRNR